MKNVGTILIALGTALALTPSVSMATDYCLRFPNNAGYGIVGRAFATPVKNTCKSFVGFYVNPAHSESATSGVGCTSSNGSRLILTLTTSFPKNGGQIAFDSVTVALPSQTGTDAETVTGSSGDKSATLAAQGGVCSLVPVPAAALGAEGQNGAGAAVEAQ